MRKIIATIIILSLVFSSLPTFAAEGGQKGASQRAFERASPQAIFHRIADWFATRGKSKEEQKAIIAERKAKRAAIRKQKQAEKEAEKKKKRMEREAKRAQKAGRKKRKD